MADPDLDLGIDRIRKLSDLAEDWESQRTLKMFVELHPWVAPLLYGSLYMRSIGSEDILTFSARKTVELLIDLCHHVKKTGEDLSLACHQQERVLMTLGFLVIAFDSTALRQTIKAVRHDIDKQMRSSMEGFIDRIPSEYYLTILQRQIRENKEATQPISLFFDKLCRQADPVWLLSVIDQDTASRSCVESLVEDIGRRLEKPDRLFSYSENLDTVAKNAEALFDMSDQTGRRFFNKYKWAYPRGQVFSNLDCYWITCMIGVLMCSYAIGEYVPSNQEAMEATPDASPCGSFIRGENAVVRVAPILKSEWSERTQAFLSKARVALAQSPAAC